jgi:transcriptional regulator with XRE-family HTH domain
MGPSRGSSGWFGARLTELREKAGLTPEQLAQRVNMTLGALTQLERGERSPAWSTLMALARALDVGVEVFAEEMAEDTRPRRGRTRRPGDAPKDAGHPRHDPLGERPDPG